MANSQTLRNRKKGDKKKSKPKAEASSGDDKKDLSTTIEVGLPPTETLSQTFFQHPLVRVAPFVLLPYVIYQTIYFATLRKPEIISKATLGLVNFRPSLTAEDPRQVLILGPEIPENRFVSGGLASPLKLEIVHEAFDAQNYYCRDGTVSWFQLMRFLEPIADSSENKYARFGAWKELCMERNHTIIQLFHPKEYGIPTECSSYDKWSNCWAKVCFDTIKSIWGCENDEFIDCPQQFSRILHQARHPLRTIETLQASVCPYPALRESFLNVIAGFFPARKWDSLSCLDAMAWYTIDFHNLLLKARAAGLVHGVFQIENTSPCEVAAMAGFVDEPLYPPTADRITRYCRELEGSTNAQSPDCFTKVKQENKGDKIEGLIPVSIDQFGDAKLKKELKKLVSALAYDKQGDSEFL